MSTTQTQEPSVLPIERQEPDFDGDPREVFDEQIADDHTVCSRCFWALFELRTVAIPVRYADDDHGYEPVEEADVSEDTVLCQAQERTENVETVHPPRVHGPIYKHYGDGGVEKLKIPQERKRANPPEKIVCECGAIDRDGTRAPLAKQDDRYFVQVDPVGAEEVLSEELGADVDSAGLNFYIDSS